MATVLARPARAALLPAGQPVRGMATLKEISMRLKSVKNIQKITKSMKMVSAAKFTRAERELKPARVFGIGANAMYQKVDFGDANPEKEQLMVVMTSDRGLCGSVHSNVVKNVRAQLDNIPAGTQVKLITVGDKARSLLQSKHKEKFLVTLNEYGRKPPTFDDASFTARQILESGYSYDSGTIFYNHFKSVVSFKTTTMPFVSAGVLNSSNAMYEYDSLDAEVLKSYAEFSLAAMVYGTMKESAASEQSSRMTAMDSASKNAGEMIDKLTLTFNRTRQAVITRELIEIISGAAALD